MATAIVGLFVAHGLFSETPATRPHIFGLVRVQFYSTNPSVAYPLHKKILDIHDEDCELCQKFPSAPLFVDSTQAVQLEAAPTPISSNLISEIMFATDDALQLRRYLEQQKIQILEPAKHERRTKHYFAVLDPEGHRISFTQNAVQASGILAREMARRQLSLRLIHAGFVVRDRGATDHFYKDILGFRPYWHRGMKDDKNDWVAMQVPDGTDWIEYMLNIPLDADKKLLGVMNHISLGVKDIQAAKAQLLKNGVKLSEEPQMGRDGKWQLNLYDPDFTRIEFMEFTPKQKPCCSEFTGSHPKP
jgi:catechol 2,3-dioxygenase-like lactoylglutathione lyase family enzyme